jgi:hypothetical protein
MMGSTFKIRELFRRTPEKMRLLRWMSFVLFFGLLFAWIAVFCLPMTSGGDREMLACGPLTGFCEGFRSFTVLWTRVLFSYPLSASFSLFRFVGYGGPLSGLGVVSLLLGVILFDHLVLYVIISLFIWFRDVTQGSKRKKRH